MSNRRTLGTSVLDVWAVRRKRGLPINPSKRWLGRAQIRPGVARYRTKAFQNEQEAWTWAEDQVAKYRLGVDTGARCTLRSIMPEYLEHLAGKGVSPQHHAQATWILGLLADAGINDLRDERLASKVEGFFRDMKAQMKNQDGSRRRLVVAPLSMQSRNAYMSHIMALCAYATRHRYLPYDPLVGVIQRFKVQNKTKPVFSLDELRKLTSDELRSEPAWLPTIISIYSGLRIGEAMHLEWQDVKWQEHKLHIKVKPEYRLKGGKERFAPMPNELADILRPLAKPHGWIVPEKPRTGKTTWRWFFLRLLRKAGLPIDGRSPHSARHTWASLSVACGVDPFLVMELAGHATLSTSLRYARMASLYRDAVAGWLPKGQFQLRSQQAVTTPATQAVCG